MSIPANLTTEANFLQSQIQQYTPVANAPHSAVIAMQLNAGQLVADTQTALTATSNLDAFIMPSDAPTIIADIVLVATTAQNQSDISLARGVFGRVASNLDQL